MKLSHHICNEHTVLSLDGEFDASALHQHRDALNKLVDAAREGVVVDLQCTQFMDSAGVGALVFFFKRLEGKGRQFCLAGLSGQPLKLAQLLRIEQTIRSYSTLSEWMHDNPVAVPAQLQRTKNRDLFLH